MSRVYSLETLLLYKFRIQIYRKLLLIICIVSIFSTLSLYVSLRLKRLSHKIGLGQL
jgi:hypothetical protein